MSVRKKKSQINDILSQKKDSWNDEVRFASELEKNWGKYNTMEFYECNDFTFELVNVY